MWGIYQVPGTKAWLPCWWQSSQRQMLPRRLRVSGHYFPAFLCLHFLICLVGMINPHRVLGEPSEIMHTKDLTWVLKNVIITVVTVLIYPLSWSGPAHSGLNLKSSLLSIRIAWALLPALPLACWVTQDSVSSPAKWGQYDLCGPVLRAGSKITHGRLPSTGYGP